MVSLKIIDLSSTGLEITMVLICFRKFSCILKKEEKHCNSENTEVKRQIYSNYSSSLFEAFQFKEIGH